LHWKKQLLPALGSYPSGQIKSHGSGVVVVVVVLVVVVVVVVVVGSAVVVLVVVVVVVVVGSEVVVVVVGFAQGTSITWQSSSPEIPGTSHPHSASQVRLCNSHVSNSFHLSRQVPSQTPVVVVLVVVDP
jgi:hypothetical protein